MFVSRIQQQCSPRTEAAVQFLLICTLSSSPLTVPLIPVIICGRAQFCKDCIGGLPGMPWYLNTSIFKKRPKKRAKQTPSKISSLLESSQSRNLDLGIQPSMFVFPPLSRSWFTISCSVLRMLEISAHTTQQWTPPSFSLGQDKEGILCRIHTPVSWLMLLRHQMLEGPLS